MPELNQVAGILLAAGESKRFGTENKLLLSISDQSIIHQSLSKLLESRLESVYLVTGHQSELVIAAIAELAQHDKLSILENRDWQSGQTSSKRIALEAVSDQIEGALFCLGDMPLMNSNLINLVLDYFIAEGQITFPVLEGKKGHPIIWPRAYWSSLTALGSDESGMDLVKEHWESSARIELMPSEVHTQWDVDTRESYQNVINFLEDKS